MSAATGRGILVTFGFDVATQLLVTVQALLVPRLLGPETIGLYGLAIAVLSVGTSVKELGIDEKLMQEREVELPRAYSAAFTLELAVSTALFVAALAVAPIIAAYYDRSELVPIIAVLGITLYTSAFLRLPGALHLRELRYGRQSLLVSVRPIVAFAVTVPLAFAGAGIWSLVWGAVAAFLASVAVVTWGVPLRPRLRFDRAVLRRYLRYGWPLWVANLLSLSTTWAGTFAISTALGLSALGFFSVTQSLGQRAFKLDSVLGQAIFPALCRAQNDLVGQRKAFIVTNRVTVMWAGPIGFGLFVFAPDLVHLVLGSAWEPAVFLIQMQGLAVTIGSIGFSWDVFFRARGETRPTLVFAAVSEAWVFVVLLPAAVLWGLDGAAWAIAAFGVISVTTRQIVVRHLFPGINLIANAGRELLTTGAVAVAVWAIRDAVGPPKTLLGLALFLVLFVTLSAAALLAFDWHFLRDLAQRLRRSRGGPAVHLGTAVTVAPAIDPAGEGIAGADPVVVEKPFWLRTPSTPARVVDEVSVPGQWPVFVAPGHDGRVFVSLRDSSDVAMLVPGGAWRTWHLPAYPNQITVDPSGRAWTALTLSSAVAVIDPLDGSVTRHRVGRSKELLGAAWCGTTCRVVDAANRTVVAVGDGAADAIALPAAMGRPAFLATDGDQTWVTDASRTSLAVIDGDASRLVEVHLPTRVVVSDGAGVWAGATNEPALVRANLGTRRLVGVPGVPFGLAASASGEVWASLPSLDAVVLVAPDDTQRLVTLPPGSQPMGLAIVGTTLWVCCPGRGALVNLEIASA